MQNGPKAFWLSFFLTLAILIPLLGGFVLYGLWQRSTAAPAQIAQSGVPIGSPTQENDHTLFVAVAAEQPGFVLLRLDGVNNIIRVCPVPAASVVSAPSGPTLLRDSYASAGPGRAAELLSQTLNIQIDRYLAIAPASLATAWNGMEPPRVNLTGLLEPQELAALGLSEDPVVSLAPESASEFLAKLTDEGVPPARLERIRGAELVFRADAEVSLLDSGNASVLALRRQYGEEWLVALFNFSEHPQSTFCPEGPLTDLVSGAHVSGGSQTLPGYGFLWLKSGQAK